MADDREEKETPEQEEPKVAQRRLRRPVQRHPHDRRTHQDRSGNDRRKNWNPDKWTDSQWQMELESGRRRPDSDRRKNKQDPRQGPKDRRSGIKDRRRGVSDRRTEDLSLAHPDNGGRRSVIPVEDKPQSGRSSIVSEEGALLIEGTHTPTVAIYNAETDPVTARLSLERKRYKEHNVREPEIREIAAHAGERILGRKVTGGIQRFADWLTDKWHNVRRR